MFNRFHISILPLLVAILSLSFLVSCENLSKMVPEVGQSSKETSSGEGMFTKGLPSLDDLVITVSKSWYGLEINSNAKDGKIETNKDILDQIEKIFKRLRDATMAHPKYKDVVESYEWEANVINRDDQALAKAFAGGGIALYNIVFPLAENEAPLAGILAHEMTHVLEGHGIEDFKKIAAGVGAAGIAAAAASGKMDPKVYGPMAGALGLGYLFGVDQPFGGDDESDADCSGLKLAARAGYNPKEIIDFWDSLSQRSSSDDQNALDMLSAHRPDGERSKLLKNNCQSDAEKIFQSLDKSVRILKSEPLESQRPDLQIGEELPKVSLNVQQ